MDIKLLDIFEETAEETATSCTDEAWKDILSLYFKDFMELCWNTAYQEIDWSKGYEVLEQELLNILQHEKKGKNVADKLIKVWLKNGDEACVIIHLEVQGQWEENFSERMFIMRYRTFDQNKKCKHIASLAIMVDPCPNWRPFVYENSFWSSSIKMEYPILKILDFKDKKEMLQKSENPFAIVILAQLAALETRKNKAARVISKTELARELFKHGLEKEKILSLYKFLEGVLVLSGKYKLEYLRQERKIEEEFKVSYMTTSEWYGHQRGLQEGEANVLLSQLECKFNSVPIEVQEKIKNADADILLIWCKRILNAKTLEEIFVEA